MRRRACTRRPHRVHVSWSVLLSRTGKGATRLNTCDGARDTPPFRARAPAWSSAAHLGRGKSHAVARLSGSDVASPRRSRRPSRPPAHHDGRQARGTCVALSAIVSRRDSMPSAHRRWSTAPSQRPAEPLTIHVRCPECGGAITLQTHAWTPDVPAKETPQTWRCPYCTRQSTVWVEVRIAWATAGHDVLAVM